MVKPGVAISPGLDSVVERDTKTDGRTDGKKESFLPPGYYNGANSFLMIYVCSTLCSCLGQACVNTSKTRQAKCLAYQNLNLL